MTAVFLLPLLILLAGVVVVGLITAVVAISANSGRGRPLPIDPRRPVSLNARVFRPEQTFSLNTQFDSSLYGRLSISDGRLYWDPQLGERWTTPVSSITVLGASGPFELADPHLDIEIEGSGRWRMVVSDDTINRFVRNDGKRVRETRRARELGELLVRGGARPAP